MIEGSIVALVTPMLPDSSIDWESMAKLIDWHVESGTDAIVAVGTSGESPTLDVDEHLKVIEFVVQHCDGRIPVVAGTGANSTSEAIELTRAAEQLGADYSLQVVPYYNKPTQEGLYLHFRAIAESTDLPVILYNVPGRTSVDLANETVVRLASVDNIVGIKDATGALGRGRDLIATCPAGFAIYSGDDFTAAELILSGGKGNISVTANVVPDKMAQLCHAALAGDRQQAMEVDAWMQPLNQALFVQSNPIPVKWALHIMGRINTGIRLPLTPLSEEFRAGLNNTLTTMQILD
jgi:4-hydroxy-tetrahydrodipicolinate synthase